MTEANQKVMYEHFLILSKEGDTPIQRKYCKKYAADILGSFPQFGKKPEKKSDSKDVKENK